VNDHDFPSLGSGKVVPHGLYDIDRNIGYITLGTSHDTSEFGCACIRGWWTEHGKLEYPKASAILLLCDCGGSNNARYYIFKEDLQKLSEFMKQLPYEQKEVVALHLKGGIKFREIARLQNTSINTVQSRYRYGLEKLRSLFNNEVTQ